MSAAVCLLLQEGNADEREMIGAAVNTGRLSDRLSLGRSPTNQWSRSRSIIMMISMPAIRPISDLRNKTHEISELCHRSSDPVFITKNGVGDMVVMSLRTWEREQARLALYEMLEEAETEYERGERGVTLATMRKRLKR